MGGQARAWRRDAAVGALAGAALGGVCVRDRGHEQAGEPAVAAAGRIQSSTAAVPGVEARDPERRALAEEPRAGWPRRDRAEPARPIALPFGSTPARRRGAEARARAAPALAIRPGRRAA